MDLAEQGKPWAVRELFNRLYGKATQPVLVSHEGPTIQQTLALQVLASPELCNTLQTLAKQLASSQHGQIVQTGEVDSQAETAAESANRGTVVSAAEVDPPATGTQTEDPYPHMPSGESQTE